jgi:hypothetical protein
MVLLHFALAGLPCGDEAHSIAPESVDNDQYAPQGIPSQGYEALLAFHVGVVDGYGERIVQRLFRVREADAVLAQICPRLGRIKFDVHGFIMHILCISSSLAASPRFGRTTASPTRNE